MRKYFALFAVALIVASLPAMAARLTTIPIEHDPLIVFQAYPGDSCLRTPDVPPCSPNHTVFIGNKLGFGGDPITSVPGVLEIVPGDDWSNYVSVSAASGEYAIKSVRLRKLIPEFLQCSWVYNDLPDVLQRGSENIRLWWPLMYEAPGTRWILEIAWTVPGQNPPVLYNETWTWQVHADLSHLGYLMDLFHELPWGTCEVPLISYSALYYVMRNVVHVIGQAWPNDPLVALAWVLILENGIIDHCISVCPPSPMPYDELGRLGITNTDENPACCKLLIDIEYIAFDMGIFTPGQ